MNDRITATKAKNNFGELIRQVYTTGDPVIVEKDGIPIVIIGPIPESDLRRHAQVQTTDQQADTESGSTPPHS